MSPAVEIAVRNSAGLPGAFWAWMAVFSVLLGACIGSFLNVCICRIPLGQSVVRPRSHCMSCGSLIPWFHNIPVLSYFALRGKCAKCGAPFSFRYAGIELLTAFLFLAVFCLYPPAGAHAPLGFTPLFGPDASVEEVVRAFRIVPVYWLFVSGLLVGTFIDFDHFILPDSVTIGGMVAGPVLSMLVPALQLSVFPVYDPGSDSWFIEVVRAQTVWQGLCGSLLGLCAGFVPLQFIRLAGTWIFRKRGRIGPDEYAMGFGDIKLIGAIGAFLGWQAALFTILGGAFFGTLIAIPLLLSRRRSLLDRIPFGPYLSLAALTWLFWGPRLALSYVRLMFH